MPTNDRSAVPERIQCGRDGHLRECGVGRCGEAIATAVAATKARKRKARSVSLSDEDRLGPMLL